jgi:hypothetical protein
LRISQEALDECESLFQGFLEQRDIISLFRGDLFDAVGEGRDLYSETVRVLTQYQFDRALGAYCLIVNGLVWDSEIVLRSFYETVVKVFFLSTASTEIRGGLLTEFWEVLPAIYDAKGAERAKSPEKLARSQGRIDDARIFEFLRRPENFATEGPGNRQFRKSVEQKWSFSKIVDVLNTGNDGHKRIARIDTMFHNYGISSHLAHASPKAFDLLEDRSTRGDDLSLLEVGHVGRMLSDIVSLTAFSLHQVQISLLGDMPMADILVQAYSRMSDLTKPYQEAFQRSQDDLYRNSSQ